MLKNYFKIALRNLRKHKLFSVINLFGLALCLSFCLLVIVLINDQNRFDRFHPRGEELYRVNTIAHRKDGGTEPYASSPYPLGAALQSESPAIENVVRLAEGLQGEAKHGDLTVRVRGFFTEPDFLNVFGFTLERGNPATALAAPNAIVLTHETAQKFFGANDPLGQTLSVEGCGDFVVTGVLKEAPGKTHLEFEALGSALALPLLEKEKRINPVLDDWNNYYMSYTYVRLRSGTRAEDVQPALVKIPQKFYGNLKLETRDQGYSFELQPLNKITPGPVLSNNLGKGMPQIVLVFLGVLALVGMVAAVFNYTNLTLARSLARAKEVGIRKVTGASRAHLFYQFMGEAILMALLALAGAEIFLRALLIPGFEQLQLAQSLEIDFVIDAKIYLYFIGFAILIGSLAGLLPAALISAFQPTQVLKDLSKVRFFARITLRKALMVLQFALALVLVIVLTVMYKQVDYALRLDYGFAWQNVINVDLQGRPYQVVATAMARHSGVTNYSASSHNMGTWEDSSIDIRKTESEEPITVRDYSVDARFIENFGLTLAAGNNFKAEATYQASVLVNQKFLERFRLGAPQEAIGQTLIIGDSERVQIAGVVQNFIFKPLVYELQPLLLRHDPESWRVLNLKINGPDAASVIAHCTNEWKALDSAHPLQYKFYEEVLQDVYKMFRDIIFMVGFLSLLAFTISMLGLLGIATFTAETKIKEVGVRKVLGADVSQLVLLLSRHYMILLGVAALIAVPFSLWLANLLLQQFAFRITLGPSVILPGLLVVFMTGAITVGWQALRAALTNPVQALRYE